MRLFILLFLCLLCSIEAVPNNSWGSVLETRKGSITVYYYPDNSEVEESRDIVDKFEEDLIKSFASYLETRYKVGLEVRWIKVGNFNEILQTVESGGHGEFGVSTISITEERAQRLNFTTPYLADVQVIVTNEAFRLANTPAQLGEFLDSKNAFSIARTTLEEALVSLKSELAIDFEVSYVTNSGELVEEISTDPNAFGYVDLINFLVSYEKLAQLKRQLFFPVKLKGIGMTYPKGSDWDRVIQEYFESEQFRRDKEEITYRYFGTEIGGVVNQMTSSSGFGLYEEIIISTREKEIQYQELLETLKRERDQHNYNDRLLIILGIAAFAGAILMISYRIKSQANRVLVSQQETIEERNSELNKLNEEKNEIIKVLAHDLRSPLSNIQGCALMLGEEEKLKPTSRKMVDIIEDASNRIKFMISKILDVDAIESGERNLQLEVVTPSLVIQELIHQNRDKSRRKQITVTFIERESLKVKADRFYLAQVLENLLLNALKFSDVGSEVSFDVVKHQEKIRISVKDFGPGIPKGDQKNVFKKFAKLSAKTTGGEESIGLGLSIVKKYTEMMGGTVSFETEVGVGTEFYVDLEPVQSSSIASKTSITIP